MKIDSNAATRTGLYTERGCGPAGWGCRLFSAPRPTGPQGPRAPLLYIVVSGDIVPAGFPEKKTGRPSGVLRGCPPKRLFAPFGTAGSERVLHAEKGYGRAFDILFSGMPHGMRGQTEKPFYTGLA